MSPALFAHMKNQMEQMKRDMRDDDNEEQNAAGQIEHGPEMYNDDTSEDEPEMPATIAGSQSLSAKFNRLTVEASKRVSSSARSAFTQGSSSSTARAVNANESPMHITIPGDYVEVDNSYVQVDINSHQVRNNIIKGSFEGGEQGDNGVWRMLDMFFFCVS